jgi:hypothetical protein
MNFKDIIIQHSDAFLYLITYHLKSRLYVCFYVFVLSSYVRKSKTEILYDMLQPLKTLIQRNCVGILEDSNRKEIFLYLLSDF